MHPERGRVGLFFLFAGLVLLILFTGSGSTAGENVQVGYFFLSLVSFILAFFLIRKDWKSPGASARFRTFRKFTQKKPGGKAQGKK